MKRSLLTRLIASAVLLGAAVSAQAANYIEISGANVDFFYDSDFFGAGSATVTGNAISFGGIEGYSDYANIVVRAHAGFTLSGAVTPNISAYYIQSAAMFENFVAVSSGTYADGQYTPAPTEDDLPVSIAGNKVWQKTVEGEHSTGTLESDGALYSYAYQTGAFNTLGLSTGAANEWGGNTGINWLSYEVAVNAVGALPGAISAVPEPGSWAMLLAGLAVVGGVARRRRSPRLG